MGNPQGTVRRVEVSVLTPAQQATENNEEHFLGYAPTVNAGTEDNIGSPFYQNDTGEDRFISHLSVAPTSNISTALDNTMVKLTWDDGSSNFFHEFYTLYGMPVRDIPPEPIADGENWNLAIVNDSGSNIDYKVNAFIHPPRRD